MKGDEAAKEKGMNIIKGCIVFGLILALAPNIVIWLTNIDYTTINLPMHLADKITLLINAIQAIGAALAIFGLIYGGYQYSKIRAKLAEDAAEAEARARELERAAEQWCACFKPDQTPISPNISPNPNLNLNPDPNCDAGPERPGSE